MASSLFPSYSNTGASILSSKPVFINVINLNLYKCITLTISLILTSYVGAESVVFIHFVIKDFYTKLLSVNQIQVVRGQVRVPYVGVREAGWRSLARTQS